MERGSGALLAAVRISDLRVSKRMRCLESSFILVAVMDLRVWGSAVEDMVDTVFQREECQ